MAKVLSCTSVIIKNIVVFSKKLKLQNRRGKNREVIAVSFVMFVNSFEVSMVFPQLAKHSKTSRTAPFMVHSLQFIYSAWKHLRTRPPKFSGRVESIAALSETIVVAINSRPSV